MRQDFRFAGGISEAVVQDLCNAAVQELAAAFQKIFVCCVLDERVLESVIALRRQALHHHDVRIGKLFQRRLGPIEAFPRIEQLKQLRVDVEFLAQELERTSKDGFVQAYNAQAA